LTRKNGLMRRSSGEDHLTLLGVFGVIVLRLVLLGGGRRGDWSTTPRLGGTYRVPLFGSVAMFGHGLGAVLRHRGACACGRGGSRLRLRHSPKHQRGDKEGCGEDVDRFHNNGILFEGAPLVRRLMNEDEIRSCGACEPSYATSIF